MDSIMAPRDLETKLDIQNEQEVLEVFRNHIYCDTEIVPSPKFYSYDATLVKDRKVVAFVEVKCRKIASTKYATTKIDLNKFIELKRLEQIVAPLASVFLVVRWTDRIGYLDMFFANLEGLTPMNRINERWEGDKQIAAEIPVSLFNFIEPSTEKELKEKANE